METNTDNNNIENTPQDPVSESTALSDSDLQDILQQNGFSNLSSLVDSNEDSNIDSDDASNDADAIMGELSEAIDDHLSHEPSAQESVETSTDEGRVEITDAPPSCKIPLNSKSLLVDESTSRFSGAEWFSAIQSTSVIIAGIGGIGSNVAFQLARMAPVSIVLYDNDNVERVNMAGQLYSKNDIGKSKVDALSDMISLYTSAPHVLAIKELFTASTEAGDIMICGFDNMTSRKVFFSSWLKHVESKSPEEKAKCLYIDGRLSMDTLQILCIQGDDVYSINRYKNNYLFSDSEADLTVCSMKQTTYLACMIGSLIVNLFTNFIANTLHPVIPYDLPFFTEYDAQNMIFKTVN